MEQLTAAMLTDQGICPTCYDRTHDHALFGDCSDQMLYENSLFEVLLVDRPRAAGHTVIISKAHYKDMMAIPDDLCEAAFVLAKRTMNTLRQVYGAESVYLCTMCDGPMNHFHVQLIPRYAEEKRGSRNFVKERKPYVPEPEKIALLRQMLKD